MSIMEVPIKVMSYNIWFDEEFLDERLKSLAKHIEIHAPDVVCMQEVLSSKYDFLKKSLGFKYSYPDVINYRYGCAIFSNYPISKARTLILPSNMGREMIMAKIAHNILDDTKTKILSTQEIVVFTFHFESEFDRRNILKNVQYEMVSKLMNKLFRTHNNVIMCADTNVLIGEEPYFLKCFINAKDAWTIMGKDPTSKYTYDGYTNQNLKKRKILLQSRIDRILYQTNGIIMPIKFELITGLPTLIEPSDHHGIMTHFRVFHIV
jgi:tyrosyl-DNA phosphodiesterase 2